MADRQFIGAEGVVYDPVEHLGPGGFGSVERVRTSDGNGYALKTLHLGFDAGVLAAGMRGYEPFFLEQAELSEHGRWLWGGAMHVYTPKHRPLTADPALEWFGLLMP
jgi:hypothetical protein